MNKFTVLKSGLSLSVDLGVAHIVGEIISANVTTKNRYQKAIVFVGKTAISSAVSEVVRKHVDDRVAQLSVWATQARIEFDNQRNKG